MAFGDITEFTSEPPCNLTVYSTLSQGSASGLNPDGSPKYTSGGDAYGAAVAAAVAGSLEYSTAFYDGTHADDTTSVELAAGTISVSPVTDGSDDGDYSATAQGVTWGFAYYSATNYLKIYWLDTYTEVDGPGADPVVTTSENSYEWTGADVEDGYSISEAAALNGSDASLWNQGPAYTVAASSVQPSDPAIPPLAGDETTATRTYSITGIRWSCVPGYIPPADGSSNGFPGYVAPPPPD